MPGIAIVSAATVTAFTLAVLLISLLLLPRWRRADHQRFLASFARALVSADKVQPILLMASIISTLIYTFTLHGQTAAVAGTAATLLVVVMVGSLLYLVPLQRRIVRLGNTANLAAMKARWMAGHLARTAASLIALALIGATIPGSL